MHGVDSIELQFKLLVKRERKKCTLLSKMAQTHRESEKATKMCEWKREIERKNGNLTQTYVGRRFFYDYFVRYLVKRIVRHVQCATRDIVYSNNFAMFGALLRHICWIKRFSFTFNQKSRSSTTAPKIARAEIVCGLA